MLRQGRYKSLFIEGDFGLLNVVDYIHLNPVRAGILPVSQLKEYLNSSFPKYFSKYRHSNLRCENLLKEAGELSPTPAGMRSYHNRLKLIMAESPKEREKVFKDLSRGWYISSKEGKQQLQNQIQQGTAKANGEAKVQLQASRIEELLRVCLNQLNKETQDIDLDKKSATWKLAIASYLKSHTGIRNPHLCDLLNLGHPATMSNHISNYNRKIKQKCQHNKKLKILKY